jgi:hypothetical protein
MKRIRSAARAEIAREKIGDALHVKRVVATETVDLVERGLAHVWRLWRTTTLEAPVTLFAAVTIGDANANATDKLTITLSGAGGALADGGGFSGLTTSSAGVYTLSGTAIEDELDALVFTPKAAWPNASATTTFTLSDVSSAYATPAVDSTTTVIDNDPSGAISVSAAYLAANIDGIARARRARRAVSFVGRHNHPAGIPIALGHALAPRRRFARAARPRAGAPHGRRDREPACALRRDDR